MEHLRDYPDTPLGYIREKSPHQSNGGFLNETMMHLKCKGSKAVDDSLGVTLRLRDLA